MKFLGHQTHFCQWPEDLGKEFRVAKIRDEPAILPMRMARLRNTGLLAMDPGLVHNSLKPSMVLL